MALTTEQWNKASDRFVGLFREVGTLLMAFAPLDYAMQIRIVAPWVLTAFLLAGATLFVFSVMVELRVRQ